MALMLWNHRDQDPFRQTVETFFASAIRQHNGRFSYHPKTPSNFTFGIIRGMAVRAFILLLWVIAISALVGVMRLPKVTDIYIYDHYIAVYRWSLIAVIFVVLVLPLFVVTVRNLRSGLR
jgi:hypothetical protein